MLEYFVELITTFVANYQPVSDVLIHLIASSMLHFHYDNLGITTCIILCSLYVPQIIELYWCRPLL